jgi:hypothetical protein
MAVLGASSLQINSATLGSQTGSAPMYACRAWVNFDGSTAGTNPASMSIRGNGNVSSVTRTATGTFTVNFTTAMPDANYSAFSDHSASTNNGLAQVVTYTSTSLSMRTVAGGNLLNASIVSVSVFR